jgi:hypothetical protein
MSITPSSLLKLFIQRLPSAGSSFIDTITNNILQGIWMFTFKLTHKINNHRGGERRRGEDHDKGENANVYKQALDSQPHDCCRLAVVDPHACVSYDLPGTLMRTKI